MSFKFHNKRHLGNIHFVHMTIRLNSNSRLWWERKQKDFHIMYQVQFLFIFFCYGCLRCNYKHLMMKVFEHCWSIMHFLEFEPIYATRINNKKKVTPSCVISYNNQIIQNCDNKLYYKVFLFPHLHITIYNSWSWSLVTFSHMNQQFWKFVTTLYYITNLAFNNLLMKIVQNLFIRGFICFMHTLLCIINALGQF
jgi:hypothetical protein